MQLSMVGSKMKTLAALHLILPPFNSLQAPDEMLKLIKGSYEQQWAAMYITQAWL